MNELVRVRIGECLCPGTPHADGDFVSLRPILDLRGGFRVKQRLIDMNRQRQMNRIRTAFESGKVTAKELALRYELPVDTIKQIVNGTGEFVELHSPDPAEMQADLAESYLLEGIYEWNLVGSDGPIPVTPESIRQQLFTNYGLAEVAADKADDLYRPAVLDPLLQRGQSSLPDTPTAESTSQTNGNGREHPKRSKRSSTANIQMDDTVPIT